MIITLLATCKKDDGIYMQKIYVTPYAPAITLDSTLQFTAHFYPEGSNKRTPDGAPQWSSTNEEIATVDENGVVKPVKVGETYINVKWGDYETTTLLIVDKSIRNTKDALMQLLLRDFDADGNGELQGLELASVTQLNLRDLQLFVGSDEPVSLAAVSEFVNLKKVVIYKVNAIDIELYKNPKLEEIDCSQCNFAELDVSGCKNLRILDCHNCPNLSKLTLGSKSEMKDDLPLVVLNCSDCQIDKLDLSRCSKLEYLSCSNNKISAIDLTACSEIKQLTFYGNDDANVTFPPDFDMSQLKTFE